MSEAGSAASFDQESELLPRDLPPLAIRILAWFVIALVMGLIAVALFVALPETVACPFTLVPEAGADPVKAPISGTIDRVNVADGREVKAGELMFSIRSEDLGILAERVKKVEKEIAAIGANESGREDRHQSAVRAAETRARSLSSEIQYARQRKEIAGRLMETAKESFKSGLISEAQVLAARQADADAGQGLERLRREAEDARTAIAQLEAEHERETGERSVTAARLEGELAESRAALAFRERETQAGGTTGDVLDRNAFPVLAPYDGTVTGMGPRRSGTVIERGQVLCAVARANARLRAELTISELEAGHVSAGQRVKLQLDAFPYTRYGTKSATISWVSPTAQDGVVRSQASLINRSVVVDGVVKPLRAGMSGKAHVITGKRTLSDFAFESLRQLKENAQDQARTAGEAD